MNELTRIDSQPPATQDPQDLMAMAVKQGANVETLERLMVVRRELRAEAAKEAFHRALAEFQKECPQILRSKVGHEGRYNYAPLERIAKVVGPFLAKHGFSYQIDAVVSDGWVEAIITTTHAMGHQEVKRFKVPAESKAGMSPQQKYGAAMTYAKRYVLCAAFGILTADADTDCPPDSGLSVTELRTALWNVLESVRGPDRNWKIARQWLTDECNMDPAKTINDLTAEDLTALIKRAKEKLK